MTIYNQIADSLRQIQIATAQANARRFGSASILGRVGSRKLWNFATLQNNRCEQAEHGFTVYAYYSRLHTRGYSESEDNIPHQCPVRYKINVKPRLGQPMFDDGGADMMTTEELRTRLEICLRDGNTLAANNRTLRAELRSAREANSRYFYELSKMKARPELVVLDCGEYEDTTGRLRHAWSIWLDGVRLYTTSVLCDWAEQPERLWLTKEALERALGVKAMKVKAKGFNPENVGGGPRKLTPLWEPHPFN